MSRKILILTGGPKKKLDLFDEVSRELEVGLKTASFYDIEYIFQEKNKEFKLRLNGQDIADFDLIYIRMVGKRLEDATLVVNYARQKKIRIVDRVYENSIFVPSTISKAMEMKKLIESGIPLPETYFASLHMIKDKAREILGFPYVLKSTSGRKAREVWKIDNEADFEAIFDELREKEKQGMRFFAQKMVRASLRIRVLVVGGKVIGAITRPTKWRKLWVDIQNGGNSEGLKQALNPVPKKYSELSIKSANAAELDIAGIDILEEDETGELFVIEANAAPSWRLIAKDCGVNVEKEILTYLSSL